MTFPPSATMRLTFVVSSATSQLLCQMSSNFIQNARFPVSYLMAASDEMFDLWPNTKCKIIRFCEDLISSHWSHFTAAVLVQLHVIYKPLNLESWNEERENIEHMLFTVRHLSYLSQRIHIPSWPGHSQSEWAQLLMTCWPWDEQLGCTSPWVWRQN